MAAISKSKARSAAAPPFASGCLCRNANRGSLERRVTSQWGIREMKPDTPTLLIVDDEKTTREGLRDALSDRYDIYLAEDAQAATRLLEEEHFDVLLTDFRLPGEDGMKLIVRAKSLSK